MGINMSKVCTSCKQTKSFSEFTKDKKSNDGLKYYCKVCSNNRLTIWRQQNPNYQKTWVNNNPYYWNNWVQNNKEKMNKNQINWDKKHPHIKNWRNLLHRTLFKLNQSKNNQTESLLGYSPQQLKEHLDKQGIDWNNDHIDHKIPITWFKKSTPPHIVNDLRNLQPLNATNNIQKSNKFCHTICKEYYNIILDYIKEDFKENLVFN